MRDYHPVLEFWFGDDGADSTVAGRQSGLWWGEEIEFLKQPGSSF